MRFLFESASSSLADGSAAGKPVILGGDRPYPGRLPWTFCVEPTMCFPLDPQHRKGIARRRQQTRDHRLGMRLSALLWRDDGKTGSEIAHLLGVGERTVGNWLRLYRKKGLEALCTLHYKGDPGELTSSQAEQLKAEIQTGRFRCARQVGSKAYLLAASPHDS